MGPIMTPATVVLPGDEESSDDGCELREKTFEAHGWIRVEELIRRENAEQIRIL